jgi:phosphoglycerate dehydrogenase-like enzyme
MLRFLENGIAVRMVRTEVQTQAVDTPADLELVAALMSEQSGISG